MRYSFTKLCRGPPASSTTEETSLQGSVLTLLLKFGCMHASRAEDCGAAAGSSSIELVVMVLRTVVWSGPYRSTTDVCR